MKILMVTDSYPPLIGGATRDTALLSRELTNRGHEVLVSTVAQPGVPDRSTEDGVSVVRIGGLTSRFSADPRRRHHPPVPDPETIRKLRALLRQSRPDIVHSYGWLTYSACAATAGTAIPTVLSIRDYSNVCAVRTLMQHDGNVEHPCQGPAFAKCLRCAQHYYGSPVKAAVSVIGVLAGRRPLVRSVSGVHYCSHYVQGVIRQHLVGTRQQPRIVERVIPSFHTHEAAGIPDRATMNALPKEPYILFVGPLRRVKGIDQLLEAYGRLDNPPPLVLLGSTTGETPTSFPSNVHVFTDVSHSTVMAAWRRALFGVAPSTLPEPLGNVVHEAMSVGRAVIGTAPSGMTEMITHEINGLLVPPLDTEALRAAIDRLIRDVNLREQLGVAAEANADRFTASVVVPRFEEFYRAVLTQHRKGKRDSWRQTGQPPARKSMQ